MNDHGRCKTCGKPVPFDGATQCTNCWEVEHRLDDYLKSPVAQEIVRDHLPKLDDWVGGQPDAWKPDAWDYEAVLRDHDVTVEWCGTLVDGEGTEHLAGDMAGWGMSWRHGTMHVGRVNETIARKAAALFVSLWLRGVSASFADKLMDGFIVFLERQEQTSLTFLAEIDRTSDGVPFYRLTREGFCHYESFVFYAERKIIAALDVQPDEEVIVTFRKRKTA